jgi:prepilin-type N-terminal cleavage/methylation domain-containing protein
MSNFYSNRQRRGFTLVELLIVIVIIGILVSLAFVGGQAAIYAARRTIITKDIHEVSLAVEAYKQKYGEYPPDFSDPAAVMQHVQKRWPRFNWFGQSQNFTTFVAMVNAIGWDFSEETDSHDSNLNKSRGAHVGALAFWLGGLPEPSTGMLGGFGADPSNPLSVSYGSNAFSHTPPSQRETPLMELTNGRNFIVIDGIPVIISRGKPFVYFKPTASGHYLQRGISPAESLCFHPADSMTDIYWDSLGVAVPYAKSGSAPASAVWHNPKSFQIIHPGLDGTFGADICPDFRAIDPSVSLNVGCIGVDFDNQANFGGTTIEVR